MSNFKTRLQNRGYPDRIVEKHLSEIKFSDKKNVATFVAQKNKAFISRTKHFSLLKVEKTFRIF